MKITVRNMVCDRCKSVLRDAFRAEGISIARIDLGEIILESGQGDLPRIDRILQDHGFRRTASPEETLVEKVKTSLLAALESEGALPALLSDFLSGQTGREYSVVSKVFSRHEGMTVEKYWIRLKMERAKEYIQMGDLDFTQIAYALDYKSSSHLARQFKSITGLSMGAYRKLGKWDRHGWDKIVQE